MLEFIGFCLSGPNLLPTLLLGLVLLYWLLVIAGVLGIDMFDLDLGDSGLDGDVDSGSGAGVGSVLDFFHLGEIPVMIFASFFSLLFWIVSIQANYWFNEELSWMVMLWWMIPCAALSLLGTKFCVMPLAPMFRTSGSPQRSRIRLVGQRAVVSSSEVTERFGQIRIETETPPVVLNARVEEQPFLRKGDFVTLDRYEADGDFFVVRLEKWDPAT